MKGLKKVIVLTAMALWVASCAPGGSEEGAAAPRDQSSSLIPVQMDPAARQLTIGNGDGDATFVIDGHTVQIVNGTSTAAQCEDDGDSNSRCWVRLYNRDSDEYMANAFVATTRCKSCGSGDHIFDNADAFNVFDAGFLTALNAPGNPVGALNGYTAHGFVAMGGAAELNGAGIAYVSDYLNDVVPDDSYWGNAFGVRLRALPYSCKKPEWMIPPLCGMKSEAWDFGGSNMSFFSFWVSVKANYFPMNPVGADQAPGGGDDDPRFDFNNFHTVYLSLAALDSPAGKPGSAAYVARYRPGSFQRSTILAGYGAPGGVSTTTIVRTENVQKYFGVNVGIEASNRLELMPHASKANKYYEYYHMTSSLVTWNPKALIQVNTSGAWTLTKAGGSLFQSGGANAATYQCATLTDCQNYNTASAVELVPDVVGSAGINTTAGYMSIMNWIDGYLVSSAWQYFSPGSVYSTTNGDQIKILARSSVNTGTTSSPMWVQVGREIPKRFGARGFAKVHWQAGGLTDGGMHAVKMNSTGLIQDGVDAAPEAWAYMFIMKVNTAANAPVGTGTELKVDTFSTYTFYEYFQTNGTFETRPIPPLDGQTNAGPISRDGGDDCQDAVDVSDGSTVVVQGGRERPNNMIRHRGNGGNYGSFQAWNVGICIQ